MMTREEAIVNLEKLIALFHTASEQSKMVDYSKIIETLEFAATALRPVSREQVEKVWRGGWELVRRMAASIECKCPKCQRTVIFTGKPANFCEKCGSANTDEAVQMVMERMETVYGQASD